MKKNMMKNSYNCNKLRWACNLSGIDYFIVTENLLIFMFRRAPLDIFNETGELREYLPIFWLNFEFGVLIFLSTIYGKSRWPTSNPDHYIMMPIKTALYLLVVSLVLFWSLRINSVTMLRYGGPKKGQCAWKKQCVVRIEIYLNDDI